MYLIIYYYWKFQCTFTLECSQHIVGQCWARKLHMDNRCGCHHNVFKSRNTFLCQWRADETESSLRMQTGRHSWVEGDGSRAMNTGLSATSDQSKEHNSQARIVKALKESLQGERQPRYSGKHDWQSWRCRGEINRLSILRDMPNVNK